MAIDYVVNRSTGEWSWYYGTVLQGVQKKTDTIIFCYNSENKYLTFKNGT